MTKDRHKTRLTKLLTFSIIIYDISQGCADSFILLGKTDESKITQIESVVRLKVKEKGGKGKW